MSNTIDERLRSPFENADDLLKEIGRIVALWGTVHHLLRILTAELLRVHPTDLDSILNRFNGEGAKIDFLVKLLKARKNPEFNPLIKCLKDLKDLTKDRNIIIHSAPIKGAKRGFYELSYRYENYHADASDQNRSLEAKSFLDNHLEKLRDLGSQLFDLVHAKSIALLDAHLADK